MKKREDYSEDSEDTKEFFSKFKDVFGITLKAIYLLYISSFEYNFNRQEEVFETLKNNEINCLFYNVKKNYFTFNFIEKKYDFELNDNEAYKIYPYSNKNFIYKEQKTIKQGRN